MLKCLAHLPLVAAIVLSSALNAEKSTPVNTISDDSFSYQISKDLQFAEECDSCCNITGSTSDISIEIRASQNGTDFDGLLVNTIKELVNEINAENAANMYLVSVKNIFSKVIDATTFEALANSKSEDEAKQALGNLFQNMLNAMTSKNTMLEQAIYFATFSDEIVKDITNTMSALTQEHVIKMSQFQYENGKQDMAKEIKKIFDEFLINMLNATATVFENHGYKIDRQSLGL